MARGALVLGLALVVSGCAAHGSSSMAPASIALPACRVGSDVTWHLATPAPMRAALDRWCEAVGPPALVAAPVAREAVVRPPLVVISWNVHGAGGDLAALIADVRAGALQGLPRDAPLLLLLQEVRRAGPAVPAHVGDDDVVPRALPAPADAPDIIATASALGLHATYVPSMRNGMGAEDRGNAVAATAPLADALAIELPLEHQRRVAVGARITVSTADGPVPVRVVSLHLTTRTGPRRLWLAAAGARARQASAVAAALAAEPAVVLGGDLNTWLGEAEPTHRLLREAIGPSVRRDRTPTFAGLYRLDDAFARLPAGLTMQAWRLDRRYGSDHFPLAGVITASPGERRRTQESAGAHDDG